MLSQAQAEMLKTQPELVLAGPTGLGYDGCTSTFWQAVKHYEQEYPHLVMRENRENLH